jgi:hypothetical protein
MKLFFRLVERLRLRDDFSSLEDKARNAYGSLLQKGLVEDPVVLDLHTLLPAMAVGKLAMMMVLGNVPITIAKTTKQGEAVSKMNALFWEYECSRSPEQTQQRFEFRLLKFLKVFVVDFPKVFGTIFSQQETNTGKSVDHLESARPAAKAKTTARRSSRQ